MRLKLLLYKFATPGYCRSALATKPVAGKSNSEKTQFGKYGFSSLLLLLTLIFSQQSAFAQITTLNTNFTNNNGSGTTTFNLQNTNTYDIIITEVGGVTGSSAVQTAELYYKTTPVNGAPGAISSANGWTLAASGTFTGIANTTTSTAQPIITNASFVLPAGATYAMAVSSGSLRYSTLTAGTHTVPAGGVNLITGTNIGYGGGSAPTAPSNTPRGFIGYLKFIPATPCVAPPTGGQAVSTVASVCPNTNFKLSLTGASGGMGMTYQWQISPNGTSGWTNIAGANNANVNLNQTATNFYRAQLTCSGQTATSAPVQVTTSALPVSGTFTINKNATPSATVFTSFANALASLECGGVNGPVVFNVAPNSGPYNEKITVPLVPGVSATNTITFNGNSNIVTSTLSSTTDALLTLDGSKYIRFNNLTFSADANSTSGIGIYLTNGAQFNNLTNNTVNLSTSSTSTAYGIRVYTGANTNNIFQGNTINGGYYGVYNYGSSAVPAANNQYINNTIKDAYYYGMYFYYSDNNIIEGNDISRPTRTTGTTFYCLYPSYSPSLMISKNRIHDISAATIYGIYNYYSDSPVGSETIVKNNLIYNLNNTGSTYAIYSSSSDGVHYYHNTVSLDDQVSGTGLSRGFYQVTAATNLKFINNNISITRTTTGAKYAIYLGTTTTSIISNNNNLYVPNGNVGYYSGDKTTLADWKTANNNAYDQNSVAADPNYIDLANGNLRPNTVALDNVGQPAPAVTTDITGATRSTTTPDPGAYEFSVPPNDVAVVAISGPVSGCGLTASETITITIRNFGSATQTSIPVNYTVNGVTIGTGTWTGTLAPNATVTFTFPQTANLATSGSYVIVAQTGLTIDTNPANNALTTTIGNALLPALPVNFDFETPAAGAGAMRVVDRSNSNITESTAASNGTGSTKGMIMDGVDDPQWVVPVGLVNPWTNNPDHFSAVYMCLTPNAAPNDSLILTFDLKQLYKITHYNTNFRVTVNGQQVPVLVNDTLKMTVNPPFGGYGTNPAPWKSVKVILNQFKTLASVEIGLESSVKEQHANGTGTANLIDNIQIFKILGTNTGIKDNVLQSSVAVYPNPSNGLFKVNVPVTSRSFGLEVTDLTGRVVKRDFVPNNSGVTPLDLNGTAKGVYILKITSEGNVAARRLVIE